MIPQSVRRVYTSMYRAFFHHVIFGNLAEDVLVGSRMDAYNLGYRNGYHASQEHQAQCLNTPEA